MNSIFFEGQEFRPVPGFNGRYASDDGKMLSRSRQGLKLLKASIDKDGYLYIGRKKTGERHIRVHAAVLSAWHRPKNIGEQCRHLNGIKKDNRLINLAWGTSAENGHDKIQHGTVAGMRNSQSKLTDRLVTKMRDEARQEGVYRTMLRYMPQYSKFTVWAAITGYSWTHLPGAIVTKRRCTRQGWLNGIKLRTT